MPKKRAHGQGGLFQLKGRNLWRGVAHYDDPDTGERVQVYVHSKSQREASRKLTELKAEIDKYGVPLDSKTTVAEWFPRWLRDYKAPWVDPKTHSGYKSAINKWIIPTIGTKRIAALKPSDINAVHKAIISAGLSASTLKAVQVPLVEGLEQARRERLCRTNVAHDAPLPRAQVRKRALAAAKKRGSLSLEQAGAVLDSTAKADLASYWWFKLLEGPRQGESMGARIGDLNLEAQVYTVNRKLEEIPKDHGCGEYVDGRWPCGKKQGAACPDWRWRAPSEFTIEPLFGRWCLTEPKSKTGREVPLIGEVADLIRDYLERHADRPNPHGLIWRKEDGSPYLPKEEAQMWRDILCDVDIITAEQSAPGKSPIDGHWARHTTITVLMMLTNGDAQLVGEIVGQSSNEVTEIYRHADQSEKRAAMKRLGQTMIGGKPLEIEAA